MVKVELMAPVGSYESLMAAIDSGADSVYFGVEQLNMRACSANNFNIDDLRKIIEICKKNNVKTYLTVNTILYDHDINLMKKICDAAKKFGITAIIASDVAAMFYARSIGIEVHLSTQANVSNLETVKFYSQFVDVIVLARELTLKQIKEICDGIKKDNIRGPDGELVKIEIFAHGALCVAISGKCYMSLATYNSSANRGACLQNCRRNYRVIDEETGDELVIDNKYVMSPKDLCTIGFIDKILEAGVSVLKIEGRGRKADYVHVVIKAYREAVDSYYEGSYNKEKIKKWVSELGTVYNRGFWHGGYYLGKKLGEWSGIYGSNSTKEKVFVGVVKNYFRKSNIGEFFLNGGQLHEGDELMIMGPTTGVMETKASCIYLDDKKVKAVSKGMKITMLVPDRIRTNDKLYVIVDKK
ncbi:U32 family peptidase [Candidatus Woesearchaeota archaeon]|nr:U32 family peptidase [Candidatus Woesearchaeota archaeon]